MKEIAARRYQVRISEKNPTTLFVIFFCVYGMKEAEFLYFVYAGKEMQVEV